MSKKSQKAAPEVVKMNFVVEAIGTPREVILSNDPRREGLIKDMEAGEADRLTMRLVSPEGDAAPSYVTAAILPQSVKPGDRFTLSFKPNQKPAGAPQKVSAEDVERVIRKAKKRLTQKEVADALNVSESSVERWRARQGFKAWREVISLYMQSRQKSA